MGRGTGHQQAAALGAEDIRSGLRRSQAPQRDPSWSEVITRPAKELTLAHGVDSDGQIRKGTRIGVLEQAVEMLAPKMPADSAERARRIQREKVHGEVFVPLRLVEMTTYPRADGPGRLCHVRDAVTVRIGTHQFKVPVIATVMRRMLYVWMNTPTSPITPETVVELGRGERASAPR